MMSIKDKYNDYKERKEAQAFFNRHNDEKVYGKDYLTAIVVGLGVTAVLGVIMEWVIAKIGINFSYFFIKEILSFTSNITLAIRGIGEDLFNKNICFSELILEINKSIGISFSSLDVFSLDGIIKISLSSSLLSLVFTYAFRYIMVKIFILLTPVAFLSLILQNTSWFFKSWIRNLFSLLFIQIIVSLVLLILFSMDYSSGNLIIKFIYIGAIYALIKANSFSREFLGGVSTTISQNVNNFFKK